MTVFINVFYLVLLTGLDLHIEVGRFGRFVKLGPVEKPYRMFASITVDVFTQVKMG